AGSGGGTAGSGGGTAGSGGSATGGTGGSVTGGTGGSVTGGTGGSATGGTGGSATGGTGGGTSTCPSAQPQGACTTPLQNCAYGSGNGAQQCTCWNGNWDCDPCPGTKPTPNGQCNPGFGSDFPQCVYGTEQCMCYGSNPDWDCGSCPATQPSGSCISGQTSLSGIRCMYGAAQCTCNNGTWACSGGSACPANPPATGSSCTLPAGQVCTWGGSQCTCVTGSWFCK
ncbi:MAG: hypothetical protein L6Q84_31735, partial [Polyangiaceae bacterium]|nr:hypothetical protein [Polyangiaceae bacterium]